MHGVPIHFRLPALHIHLANSRFYTSCLVLLFLSVVVSLPITQSADDCFPCLVAGLDFYPAVESLVRRDYVAVPV